MKKLIAIASTATLVFLVSGVVRADNVHEVIVAPNTDTITVGGSTTIGYKVTTTSTDGQEGCNSVDGTPATLTIEAPVEVMVSSTSLTFTSCSSNNTNAQYVDFSSNVPGDYLIGIEIADSGVGTYATTSAEFTLHVLEASPTPTPMPTETPTPTATPTPTLTATPEPTPTPTATPEPTQTPSATPTSTPTPTVTPEPTVEPTPTPTVTPTTSVPLNPDPILNQSNPANENALMRILRNIARWIARH